MGFIYFLIYVFVELYLLINIGSYMGTLFVIFEIISTIFLGVFLIKSHSLSVLSSLSSTIQDFNNIVQSRDFSLSKFAGNTISILISGVMIIIPGFATDIIGAILFIYFSFTNSSIDINKFNKKNNKQDDIIDAEFHEVNLKELEKKDDK